MTNPAYGLHRNLRYFIYLTVALTTVGCFLMPKKKSGRGGGGSGLLDRNSVVFDRIGDGKSARLQFKSNRPALCELAFYSQEATVAPTQDAPTVSACANTDTGRSEFTEAVAGLRTDTLYNFIITIWEVGADKSSAEKVVFKEPSGTDGSGQQLPEGKLQDLYLARLNIPLRTAEVHRHTLAAPTDLAAVRQAISRQTGCQQGVPADIGPYREANKEIGLQGLVTRDFAAAAATKHPNIPERLQLYYSSINDGLDKWSLTYQLAGKDALITARPISRILNMEMESSDITQFDEPQLVEAADPLQINPAIPLKLAWTTGNSLVDQSYMTILIGRAGYEKSIYCVFPASKKSAEIESRYLQDLDDGRHVVLAELSTNQLWVKEGWIVSVYDWRSSRIEK